MAEVVRFPRFYPIADAGLLESQGIELPLFLEAMGAAGVELLQYRDKSAGPQQIVRNAATIRETLGGAVCRLMLNDRADLAVLAGWDGVHVGQGDLAPEDARRVVGSQRWVGVSTHTDEQVQLADRTTADYIAIGPGQRHESMADEGGTVESCFREGWQRC